MAFWGSNLENVIFEGVILREHFWKCVSRGSNFDKFLSWLLIGMAADWDGCWFRRVLNFGEWIKVLFITGLADKSLYTIIRFKLCDGTDIFEALTWATLVIHWRTNPEASHSLTTLAQWNHHLVVLAYLKLPFELLSYYCTRTENHSPACHHPPGTMECCTNLLLSRIPWELAVLPWRLQDFPLQFKYRPSPSVCLNHTAFGGK